MFGNFFNNQLLEIIEWKEYNDNILFQRWNSSEIKKGSKLFIKPGQSAIFLRNGKIEGVFEDEGKFDIDTQILPVLTNLKGFAYGFKSSVRIDILFVNTKQSTIIWSLSEPILIEHPELKSGLPILCSGSVSIKVSKLKNFIENIVGVRDVYTLDKIQSRLVSNLDELLMKHISLKAKNFFMLQSSSSLISKSIKEELSINLNKYGFSVEDFTISKIKYPKEIQDKINKNASNMFIDDVEKYKEIGMVDALSTNSSNGLKDSMGLFVGMEMAKNLAKNQNKVCKCGADLESDDIFCPKCGQKL